MFDPVRDAIEGSGTNALRAPNITFQSVATATRENDSERGRLLEFWSGGKIKDVTKDSEWMDLVKKLRLQPGCDMVARQHPSGLATREVLVIGESIMGCQILQLISFYQRNG